MKKIISSISMTFLVVFLLNGLALACTGIPDLNLSIVWQENGIPATLLIVPDGSGPPFTEARTSDSTYVDATIYLTLIYNCDGDTGPVADFPMEDMWLEPMGGGVVFCSGGSNADGNTDQYGNTQWSQPLSGGGWNEGACRVVVNGMPLGPPEGLPLNFNSPDLDGSGYVNLMEVSGFAEDYFSGFTFRSDLHRDGALDLSDLVVLAESLGVSCP
ncbi:MAG: hypothetical protein KAH56_09925 [Candidatus Krumholzibacteria bacterium]|nr:hypothetical protein [Candidatus Krumholzibacteria bacterium]